LLFVAVEILPRLDDAKPANFLGFGAGKTALAVGGIGGLRDAANGGWIKILFRIGAPGFFPILPDLAGEIFRPRGTRPT